MTISITKLLLILLIVLVIFGAGKLPQIMGDVGKSIRALRDGLKNDEAEKPVEIAHKSESPAPHKNEETKA